MKKAQLLGQPFVYIFIIVVIILTIIIGFKLLNKVKDVGENVEYETFFANLDKEFDSLKNLAKGSSISLNDLVVPKTVLEVCFVGEGGFNSVYVENKDDLFLTAMQSPGDKTVFMYVDLPNKVYDFLYIEDVKGEYNPTCDSTADGSIDLRAINQGTYILVEEEL